MSGKLAGTNICTSNNQQLYTYDIPINNRSNLMHKLNYDILEHVTRHRRTSRQDLTNYNIISEKQHLE